MNVKAVSSWLSLLAGIVTRCPQRSQPARPPTRLPEAWPGGRGPCGPETAWGGPGLTSEGLNSLDRPQAGLGYSGRNQAVQTIQAVQAVVQAIQAIQAIQAVVQAIQAMVQAIQAVAQAMQAMPRLFRRPALFRRPGLLRTLDYALGLVWFTVL
ncbi:hypothetical protein L211DRAFT_847329 [Terfezia boudieri ATCC MYA-4762]|uniref:Uncharacterized protein n=1 Tax=Terfezia boudieri ATCC MYA-4762 TaxID=1051890 RepID=A0A3N4LTE8_9PEZI|nr:hypothetical protein L211DRAFT_847329 [Terfezia boudieri ATCC MYA-4762]